MSNSDLPQGTATDEDLTFEDGVNDIADLLGDPETDLEEEDEAKKAADPDETDDAVDPETEKDDSEDPDGEKEEYSGGKFAADDAKVRLDDGTFITVAELRRNNLFQRDYTGKTEALKQERVAFEADYARVNDFAKNLAEQREIIADLISRYLPEEPRFDPNDPFGYIEEKAKFDQAQADLNAIRQQRDAQFQNETAKSQLKYQEWVAQQNEIAVQRVPELADPVKKENLFKDFKKYGTDVYNLTDADWKELIDSRYIHILRDAVAYRRLSERKQEIPAKIQGKPPVMKGGARQNPDAAAKQGKENRSARLKQTGSMRDGIAALMDLDL